MLMSCYLVGCEVVASSLLLYLCVMEALHHPTRSPTQRLTFGLWFTICMEKWSTFLNASREIKDESLWNLCVSLCSLAAFLNLKCIHTIFNAYLQWYNLNITFTWEALSFFLSLFSILFPLLCWLIHCVNVCRGCIRCIQHTKGQTRLVTSCLKQA